MNIDNDMKKNKFSVTISDRVSKGTPVLLEGKISDCIQKARRYGFDAVELHYSHPDRIDVTEALKALENERMGVSGIATGATYVVHKLSLTDASRKTREAAIKRLREYIDVAEILSSTLIIGCVRGNIGLNDDKDRIFNRLGESLHTVCTYAQAKNVPIVLEAINRYENNYLNTAIEIKEFIEAFGIPNLKLLLDTFHMNIEEEDMAGSVANTQDMLGYLHAADSNRWYPGRGHIDFQAIMDALHAIGYKGYISAECLPLPNGDTAASAWIKYFRRQVRS